ncbi:MAG: O-acetyl-ADP-ribose deacetylase [Firmicutes bacterium]|jgi:O-acetyl-ADP-ribose deacetylase (regulator of RNase III)|nr:O-acetyl-ADP-ribose deacetylase [Bacillota bacterium]
MLGNTKLVLVQGDITVQNTEAIVNAANSSLLGGGGVDGAIHRAAGPKLHEECLAIRAKQGGCPTGQAVITSGGNLAANYVIHTVGPIWHGGIENEPELLHQAYTNSLRLARENGIRSLSFPSISTGAYGYPIAKAAAIALGAVKDFVQNYPDAFDEIRFVLFSPHDLQVYEDAARQYIQENH